MKKIFLGLFSLVLVFGFCVGCSKDESKDLDNDKKEEVNENKIEGYAYEVGYLSKLNTGSSIILSDYTSFKNYFEENANFIFDGNNNIVNSTADNVLDSYNENYFSNKSLAVKYISLGSGSITIAEVYGIIDGDKITINYEENVPEIGTADMSGYFLIVEVDKTVTEVE